MKQLFIQFYFLFIFYNLNAQFDCGERYKDKIFSQVKITEGIVYGENYTSKGILKTLKFDIYEPVGDTSSERAVLVFMHGGAYWYGDEKHPECTLMGNRLAKMGYVVISPNYRLEPSILSLLSNENMVKAVGRGIQDTKAIIRFLDKNILEDGNTWRLSRQNFFMGGASAGALNGLHLIFLDENDTLQNDWKTYLDEIGGLEGTSGTPGYSSKVAGIISISGALGDVNFMNNNQTPFVSIHNTKDPQIPFNSGHPYSIPILPNIDGANVLHQRAIELGIKNPFYIIPTLDHTAYESLGKAVQPYFDSTVFYMVNFMRDIMGCSEAIAIFQPKNIPNLRIYPNPGNEFFVIDTKSINAEIDKIQIFDITGKMIQEVNVNESITKIDANLYAPGLYLIQAIKTDGTLLGKTKWQKL
jgi:para-nitrobenzyl esterase